MLPRLLFGVSVALSLLGNQAFAQDAMPGFVDLPADIGCSLQEMSYESTVGEGGKLTNTSGTVQSIPCWLKGNTPVKRKDIPLTSTRINGSLVPTKDFGDLQITPINSISSSGIYMAIRTEKLPVLREYLGK